jgi:hypothetical protein
MAKRTEKDGDIHIQLKVDSGQGRGWMNQKNVTKQKGNLVIEPMCVRRVIQDSAIEACRGFVQNIIIPRKGDHVEVTGCMSSTTNVITVGERFTRSRCSPFFRERS